MQTNTKKTLLEWQQDVVSSLVNGFRALFDSSSQVLLEFADAAENNRLQRLFFDAQREFYLKEELLVVEFENALQESLSAFTGGPTTGPRLGADTLSLVEVDDYERSLALETIAKRIMDKQSEELHALAQRLSALFGGRPISVEDVPANPLQIIRLFDPVSRKLEVEKEVRLVFYTLFDRYVMSRLGDLYANFNQRLIDLGILPNIRYEYQRFGAPSARAANAAAAATESAVAADGMPTDAGYDGSDPAASASAAYAGVAPLRPTPPTSAETLMAISSLLMAKRQRQQVAPALHTSVPITPTAANIGEAIADIRVLQEAPHPMPIPTGAPDGKVVSIDAALLLKVKKALEKQRQIIKNLVGPNRLDRREEDVIDIVGMLFEAMLNEKLLPNAVKTLLSHLHTKYLKIAVQSQDFLENPKHPARSLFERMLDAGIRWVREDNLRAGIYPRLQEIVTEILRNEVLDDAFFKGLINDLGNAEQKLEQQSTAAEERTLEAERGRARLDEAKAIVRQTIDEIGGDTDISPSVITFLTTTYADYLTLLLLRSDLDTDSHAWQVAYSVGEALVAAAVYAGSGQPLGESMRADLSKRLETTVGSLIPHHEQNIRRVVESLGKPAAKTSAAVATSSVSERRAVTTETAKLAPIVEVEEPSEVDDEDVRLATKLMRESGNWFVMQREGNSEPQTVKLLWVNPHTRNMLFVDQLGAKVALISANAVAHLMREGKVRRVQQEASSFVARSLRRIRRALEDSVSGHTAQRG